MEHNLAELPRVTGVPVVAALPAGAGALAPQRFREQARSWLRTAGPRRL